MSFEIGKIAPNKGSFRMDDYTFRGSNSTVFIFPSLLKKKDQLLKKRIYSSRSKFCHLRVDPNFEGPHSSGKQAEVIKVVSL